MYFKSTVTECHKMNPNQYSLLLLIHKLEVAQASEDIQASDDARPASLQT